MRSFKKIAAMILAVAMLCSFTAFAGVNLDNVDASVDAPSIYVDYNSTASQTSLLVFKGTELTNAEDVIYINQYSTTLDRPTVALPGYGDYTVMVGGTDVATAASKKVSYAPVTYSVTVNSDSSKGYFTHNFEGSLDSIEGGEDIEFFFGPKLGYKVKSVSVDGSTQDVAPAGGSITVTVNSDVVIDVTWEEDTTEGSAFTSAEIYDIPKDLDAAEEKDQAESKLVFGKVTKRADADPIEVGMYLQKKNAETDLWEDAFTSKNVGPYFAAEEGKVIDSKYGIQFFSFAKGEYKVQSYAKYGENDYVYGTEIVFEVK